jgi:hypothetical protein
LPSPNNPNGGRISQFARGSSRTNEISDIDFLSLADLKFFFDAAGMPQCHSAEGRKQVVRTAAGKGARGA